MNFDNATFTLYDTKTGEELFTGGIVTDTKVSFADTVHPYEKFIPLKNTYGSVKLKNWKISLFGLVKSGLLSVYDRKQFECLYKKYKRTASRRKKYKLEQKLKTLLRLEQSIFTMNNMKNDRYSR